MKSRKKKKSNILTHKMKTKDQAEFLDTPYCCNASRTNVLKPVRRTPHHIGILKSMFKANAVPITVNKEAIMVNT